MSAETLMPDPSETQAQAETHYAVRHARARAERRLPPSQRSAPPQPPSRSSPAEQRADIAARIRTLASLRPVVPHDLSRFGAYTVSAQRVATELVETGELCAVKILAPYGGRGMHVYLTPEVKSMFDRYWASAGVQTRTLTARRTVRLEEDE